MSIEEYLAGVRSGNLPPPTYAYDKLRRRTALKSSKISFSSIMIGFDDLTDNAWREKFRILFSDEIKGVDIKKSTAPRPPLVALSGTSHMHILYYGYICPNCLAIGATSNPDVVRVIENGSHACPLKTMLVPSSVSSEKTGAMLDRLRPELAALLYDIAKILAVGRQLFLVGPLDPNTFKLYRWSGPLPPVSEWLKRLLLGGGQLALDDNLLKQYLEENLATAKTISLPHASTKAQYRVNMLFMNQPATS
jgi:hypothetical protein